jgi:hypothetical protein
MENEKKQNINWDKIGTWAAIIGAFFMFWQSMRDIHHDMMDIRKEINQLSERITRIEVKVESMEKC